jgi:hypothetical protein
MLKDISHNFAVRPSEPNADPVRPRQMMPTGDRGLPQHHRSEQTWPRVEVDGFTVTN